MSSLTLDQFLRHQSTSGGGGGGWLAKWKKKTPPRIDVWLHTQANIESLWQHGIPRIMTRKDRDTGVESREVWSGYWTCTESEYVLQRRRHRDKATGQRVHPPKSCPMCLLLEWVRAQVEVGEIAWTQPLFRFSGDDESKAVVMHAGGIYGDFNRKEMSAEELSALKAARIFRTEAWKENCEVKLSYGFAVVDNDHPEGGVVLTIETSSLGDAVKDEIFSAQEADEETGNPFETPYCIRWKYDKSKQQYNEKYSALRMGKVALTPEIEKLIRGPAPDMTKLAPKKDPRILRAILEEHCLVDGIPWDAIFGAAEAKWDREASETDPPPAKLRPAPGMDVEDEVERPAFATQGAPKNSAPAPTMPKPVGKKLEAVPVAPVAPKRRPAPMPPSMAEEPLVDDDDLPF